MIGEVHRQVWWLGCDHGRGRLSLVNDVLPPGLTTSGRLFCDVTLLSNFIVALSNI